MNIFIVYFVGVIITLFLLSTYSGYKGSPNHPISDQFFSLFWFFLVIIGIFFIVSDCISYTLSYLLKIFKREI